MNRDEIVARLKEIIVMVMPEIEARLDTIGEDDDLHTELGLNSIGLLYIVISIETAFDISFDGVSFSDFNTVSDIINYIEKNVKQ